MHAIQAFILGIVEGVTEFLPISSTFHQIFAAKLMGIRQDEFTTLFEVFIQAGAIVSVVLLYFKEIIGDWELIKKTLAAFLPTAVVGLVLYKIIKTIFFETPTLMIAVFIGVGVVFIIVEYLIKKDKVSLKKTISSLSYKDALIIGLVQALAVVPGVSRAGAVIIGMMLMKYKRDEAAKFSFILAIPTIFAASALDLFKGRDYLFHHTNTIYLLLIGFVVAFVSSFIVIRWFIQFLKTNSLIPFGLYRIVITVLLLIFGIH